MEVHSLRHRAPSAERFQQFLAILTEASPREALCVGEDGPGLALEMRQFHQSAVLASPDTKACGRA